MCLAAFRLSAAPADRGAARGGQAGPAGADAPGGSGSAGGGVKGTGWAVLQDGFGVGRGKLKDWDAVRGAAWPVGFCNCFCFCVLLASANRRAVMSAALRSVAGEGRRGGGRPGGRPQRQRPRRGRLEPGGGAKAPGVVARKEQEQRRDELAVVAPPITAASRQKHRDIGTVFAGTSHQRVPLHFSLLACMRFCWLRAPVRPSPSCRKRSGGEATRERLGVARPPRWVVVFEGGLGDGVVRHPPSVSGLRLHSLSLAP